MQTMRYLWLLLVCCACNNMSAAAQNYFTDESSADSSFVVFKAQLLQALVQRDTTALFDMLHYTIAESPEGCGLNASKDCFIEQMGFRGNTQGDAFWRQAAQLVRCGFSKQSYISGETGAETYMFTAPSFKMMGINNQNTLLVIGENVNIRQQPSASSKVIAKVSYKRYKFNNPKIKPTLAPKLFQGGVHWVELALGSKWVGYVSESYTTLALQRELTCKRVGGEWKIIGYRKAEQFYGAQDTNEIPEPDEY